MTLFTPEEINLICIYDPGNRAGTIFELRSMMAYLMPGETELRALAEGVITKLEGMTDAEYDELTAEVLAGTFDNEDAFPGDAFPLFFDAPDPDSEIE